MTVIDDIYFHLIFCAARISLMVDEKHLFELGFHPRYLHKHRAAIHLLYAVPYNGQENCRMSTVQVVNRL